MMLGFKLLNCHIYLYIIGIATSDTFVVYTFWAYFNILWLTFWLYWSFMMKNIEIPVSVKSMQGENWTVYTPTLVNLTSLLGALVRVVLNF